MERSVLCGLILGLIVGCGKSKPAAEEAATETPAPAATLGFDAAATLKRLRSSDPRARQDATETLARYAESDPAIFPGLIEALKERPTKAFPPSATGPSSVRDAAVLTLMKVGPRGESILVDQGMPILLEGLKDKDANVRTNTARALTRMGKKGTKATDALWVVAADSNSDARDAAYEALIAIAPLQTLPVAKLLTHEDAGVRADAAKSLPRFTPYPPAAAPLFATALKDEDASVRGAALTALGTLKGQASEAIPALVDAVKAFASQPNLDLDDPNFTDIADAMVAIGAASVKPAKTFLTDKNPVIRWHGAYILGELGKEAQDAAPDLEKTLQDQDGLVASESARALVRVGGDIEKVRPLIAQALGQSDPRVRLAAVQILARIGAAGKGLVPLAIPALGDMEPRIRQMAMIFLASIPPMDLAPHVPGLVKRLKDADSPQLRARLIDLLGDIGGPEAAEVMGEAAGSPEPADLCNAAVSALAALGPAGKAGVPGLIKLLGDAKAPSELRVGAIDALARIGDPAAVPALLARVSDPDPEVRRLAVRSLGAFSPPSPETVTRLSEILQKDRDGVMKIRALQALARLGPAAKPALPAVTPLAGGSAGEQATWAKAVTMTIAGKPADAVALARTVLTSKSAGERLAGLELLTMLPTTGSSELNQVKDLLKDTTPEIRRAAAERIAKIGPPARSASSRLVDLLQDRDGSVRQAAAAALGAVGDNSGKVLKALRETARRDPAHGRPARQALRQLTPSTPS